MNHFSAKLSSYQISNSSAAKVFSDFVQPLIIGCPDKIVMTELFNHQWRTKEQVQFLILPQRYKINSMFSFPQLLCSFRDHHLDNKYHVSKQDDQVLSRSQSPHKVWFYAVLEHKEETILIWQNKLGKFVCHDTKSKSKEPITEMEFIDKRNLFTDVVTIKAVIYNKQSSPRSKTNLSCSSNSKESTAQKPSPVLREQVVANTSKESTVQKPLPVLCEQVVPPL